MSRLLLDKTNWNLSSTSTLQKTPKIYQKENLRRSLPHMAADKKICSLHMESAALRSTPAQTLYFSPKRKNNSHTGLLLRLTVAAAPPRRPRPHTTMTDPVAPSLHRSKKELWRLFVVQERASIAYRNFLSIHSFVCSLHIVPLYAASH